MKNLTIESFKKPIEKIISGQGISSGLTSLGQPTPLVSINGQFPIILTLSFANKQRYKINGKSEAWELIKNLDQIQIMATLMEESMYKIRKEYRIKEFPIYFELNKAGNIHIHAVLHMDEEFKGYDMHINNLRKDIMKICKCGSYGIDIQEVKDIEKAIQYVTKKPVATSLV